MHSKRLVSTLVIAACSILLLATGAAAANQVPTARAGSATASNPGAPAGRAGGDVYLTSYQDNDLSGATAVLSGAIGDFGAAISVLPNGTVDPEHSSQLKLALSQGSFRITIGPLHAKFVSALSHAPYNLTTCSGHAAVTGPAPVVAGSGTGAYAGITGNLRLTITGNEADAKVPNCQPFSGGLLSQTIFIAGAGTVSFP